ncbi:DUF2165 family protein [Campylobacter ornithocola]|nr:DUF2165 family protein [Campylobacter ornithocola]
MTNIVRYSKMIILLILASLVAIVVFGNITDYSSSFQFVKYCYGYGYQT